MGCRFYSDCKKCDKISNNTCNIYNKYKRLKKAFMDAYEFIKIVEDCADRAFLHHDAHNFLKKYETKEEE